MTCEEERQWECALEKALGAGGHSCLPDSYSTSGAPETPMCLHPYCSPATKHTLRMQMHSYVPRVPHCSETKDTLFLVGRFINLEPVFV